MTESPRESKSTCKYERMKACTGCCWESDQGECLRLFGRSLSSARRERFLGAVLSSRNVNGLTLSWTPNLAIMDIHIHAHT